MIGRRSDRAAKAARALTNNTLARRSYSQPPDTIVDAWEPPGLTARRFSPRSPGCSATATKDLKLARRSYSQPPDTIADAWEPPGLTARRFSFARLCACSRAWSGGAIGP